MNTILFLVLAFVLGGIAGLRSMTPLMVIAWAARFQWLDLEGTWAQFLGAPLVPWLFTLLAAAELVVDQLPATPRRTSLVPFAFRIVTGAFSGAALATGVGEVHTLGAIAGGLGAVAGTLGGYTVRTRLVQALKVPDFAVAIPEDFVAVLGGFLVLDMFFR
jgi:uncharacterized membrane protein